MTAYLPHRHPAIGMALLGLYLGLSPIYAVLGYGEGELRLIKWLAVISGVSLILLPAAVRGRLTLPGGLWSPLGFAGLLLLSIPGIVQATDIRAVAQFLSDIAYGAAFLWCFFWLAREGWDTRWILLGALGILCVFAAMHIVVALSSKPAGSGLCGWDRSLRSIYGSHYTAWATALALFLPLLGLMPVWVGRLAKCWSLLIGAGCGILLSAGLFIGGSRTALLCGTGSLVALASAKIRGPIFAAAATALLLTLMVAVDESCAEHLRLYRFSSIFQGDNATTAIAEAMGTGRLAGYRRAASAIAESPLLGHGIGRIAVQGEFSPVIEIHSLWLKWAAYCGVLAPLLFALMVVSLLRKGLGLLREGPARSDGGVAVLALLLTLAVGLVTTLVEPNALIGSFQYTAVWWAAAGTLLGMHARIHGNGWLLPHWNRSVIQAR